MDCIFNALGIKPRLQKQILQIAHLSKTILLPTISFFLNIAYFVSLSREDHILAAVCVLIVNYAVPLSALLAFAVNNIVKIISKTWICIVLFPLSPAFLTLKQLACEKETPQKLRDLSVKELDNAGDELLNLADIDAERLTVEQQPFLQHQSSDNASYISEEEQLNVVQLVSSSSIGSCSQGDRPKRHRQESINESYQADEEELNISLNVPVIIEEPPVSISVTEPCEAHVDQTLKQDKSCSSLSDMNIDEVFIDLADKIQANIATPQEFIITLILMSYGVIALPWQEQTTLSNGFGSDINLGNKIAVFGAIIPFLIICWNVFVNNEYFDVFDKLVIVLPSALFRIFSTALTVSYLGYWSIGLLLLLCMSHGVLFTVTRSSARKYKIGNILMTFFLPVIKPHEDENSAKPFLVLEIFVSTIIHLVFTTLTYSMIESGIYTGYNPNIIVTNKRLQQIVALTLFLGVVAIIGILSNCCVLMWEMIEYLQGNDRANSVRSKAIKGCNVLVTVVYTCAFLGVIFLGAASTSSTYISFNSVYSKDTELLKVRQINEIAATEMTGYASHSCMRLSDLKDVVFIFDGSINHPRGSTCPWDIVNLLNELRAQKYNPKAIIIVDSKNEYKVSSPLPEAFAGFPFPIYAIRQADIQLAHSIHGITQLLSHGKAREAVKNQPCFRCTYNGKQCHGMPTESCMQRQDYLDLISRRIAESKEALHRRDPLCPFTNSFCQKVNVTYGTIQSKLAEFSNKNEHHTNSEQDQNKFEFVKELYTEFDHSPFTKEIVQMFVNETFYFLSELHKNAGFLPGKPQIHFGMDEHILQYPSMVLNIPYSSSIPQCIEDWICGKRNSILNCNNIMKPDFNVKLMKQFVKYSDETGQWNIDKYYVDFYPSKSQNDLTYLQYCSFANSCQNIEYLLPALRASTRSTDHMINIALDDSANYNCSQIYLSSEADTGWKELASIEDGVTSFNLQLNKSGPHHIRYICSDESNSTLSLGFSTAILMLDKYNSTCTSATMDRPSLYCQIVCHWEEGVSFGVDIRWSLDEGKLNSVDEEINFCQGKYSCHKEGYCQSNCKAGYIATGSTVAIVANKVQERDLSLSKCYIPKVLVFFETRIEEVTWNGGVKIWGELPVRLVHKTVTVLKDVLSVSGYLYAHNDTSQKALWYDYIPDTGQWQQRFAMSKSMDITAFAARPLAVLNKLFAPINIWNADTSEWDTEWAEMSPGSNRWKNSHLAGFAGNIEGAFSRFRNGFAAVVREVNRTLEFVAINVGKNMFNHTAFPDPLQGYDIILGSELDNDGTIGFLARNTAGEVVLVTFNIRERKFMLHKDVGLPSNPVGMELINSKIVVFGEDQMYELGWYGTEWRAKEMAVSYMQGGRPETVVLVQSDL